MDLDLFDDGVIFHRPYVPGTTGSVDVTFSVSDYTSDRYHMTVPPGYDDNLYVNGWFDWNQDGDWDDAYENVFCGVMHNPYDEGWTGNSQTYTIEFPVPADYVLAADMWTRFRLEYHYSDNMYAMEHAYGEVEDYVIPFSELENPQVTVIYPNGGEILADSASITWTAIDPNPGETALLLVDLDYSSTGGTTWSVIDSNQINDGTYLWDISALFGGDQYLVRVTVTDTTNLSDSDNSDSVFSIDHPFPNDIGVSAARIPSPNANDVKLFMVGLAVENYGLNTASSGAYLVKMTIVDSNGTTVFGPGTQIAAFPTPQIDPLQTALVPLDTYVCNFTLTEEGAYDFYIWTEWSGVTDDDPSNDTLRTEYTKAYYYPNVYNYPARQGEVRYHDQGFYSYPDVNLRRMENLEVASVRFDPEERFYPFDCLRAHLWMREMGQSHNFNIYGPGVDDDHPGALWSQIPFVTPVSGEVRKQVIELDTVQALQLLSSDFWLGVQFPTGTGSDSVMAYEGGDPETCGDWEHSYLYSDTSTSKGMDWLPFDDDWLITCIIGWGTSPQVTVTYPNGGETLVDSVITITWTASDPDSGESASLSVDLEYSHNAGGTWSIIDTQQVNDESYLWDISELPYGDSYLLRITVTDVTGRTDSDISDTTFTIGDIVPPITEWCSVPAGSYLFGGDTLTIDYDYDIMKYEVTNEQYVTYLETSLAIGYISVTDSLVTGYYPGDENYSSGEYIFLDLAAETCRINWIDSTFSIISGYEDHPVVEVSWFGAWAYSNLYGWRLPDKEEWIKTASGMLGTDYPWGENEGADISDNANYYQSGDPYEQGGWAEFPQTTPVGFYNGQICGGFLTTNSPSPYGAYDMAGNVGDWTTEWGSSSVRKSYSGHWRTTPFSLKIGISMLDYPYTTKDRIGFRCASNPNPDPPVVSVIYPNGGESLQDSVTIIWEALDPDYGETSLLSVYLEYSPNNGNTWSVIDSNQINDSAYFWDISLLLDGCEYLVRITVTDTTGLFDIDSSDSLFCIDNQETPVEVCWGTFLGGSLDEQGQDITLDSSGNVYVTGQSMSDDFPTTSGAYDTTYSSSWDTFVAKLTADGSTLIYNTFLGGNDGENGKGIAVNDSGQAHVVGYTFSTDFPTTAGAYDTIFNDVEIFVVKLNEFGSALDYATFIGGTADERGRAIALDQAGFAYITGENNGGDFPVTPGAFDEIYGGAIDGVVAKLNPTGDTIIYATYLGDSDRDQGTDLVLDDSGNAYMTGLTKSTDFPVTPGAFDATYNGNYDVFVVQLSSDGSTLIYGSFLGGSSDDQGYGIALNTLGDIWVTGHTKSADFPATDGAFDTTYDGGYDVFAAQFADGDTVITYLGGTGDEQGFDITCDAVGNAYLTGRTTSSEFPTTAGSFDTTFNGVQDAFVSKLSGNDLTYSAFLGGSSADGGNGIFLNDFRQAYVTGYTGSANYPVTTGAFDETHNGGEDVFVSKLDIIGSEIPPAAISDLKATLSDNSIQLSWSAVTTDTAGKSLIVDLYRIYRDTMAYFEPGSEPFDSTVVTFYEDTSGVIGDTEMQHYYAVTAVSAGKESAFSGRVGEFDIGLDNGTKATANQEGGRPK